MIKRFGVGLVGLALVLVVTSSSVSSATNYRPVVIANGWSSSDIGTAAPLAASLGGSVLYANTDSLGSHTVDALRQLKPSEVVVVGGTAVLTADVVIELGEVVPSVPVIRLAGEDRIHTAALAALHTLGSAVPEPDDAGAASEASIGPGSALDYQNGYSEARFRVGTDLRPGVWQFSAMSGSNHPRGANCRVGFAEHMAQSPRSHVAVNGDPVQGVQEWLVNNVGHHDDVSTYRFGLIEGDILTLQAAAGAVCHVERFSN